MLLEAMKNGRYHVLHHLGSGSISEVYLGKDTTTGRQVVLKLLWGDASSSQQEHSFDDKVKMLAKLHHPNIVQVLDSGSEVINGTQMHFIVMPFYPYGTLATWLDNAENCKGLSMQDVGRIVRQSANALQYAHDHNIIHQDVKPSNMLLEREASVHSLLLSDFRLIALSSETLDLPSPLTSSALYMAPEQWKRQPVRPVRASDQYALAVIVYQLLTGCFPFQGSSQELMEAHLHVQPLSPSTRNPFLSQGIDMMLLRALEKKPSDRYAKVTDFASAFEQIIQSMAAPAIVRIDNSEVPQL